MKANKLKLIYLKSKNAIIGSTCICPSCGIEFLKTTKQQAFCKTKGGTKCKDKYWNTITPTKRNNVTRISPANQTFYEDFILPNRTSQNFDDDQS